MVIQHNLLAMNANRMLMNNNKKISRLTEKLSSGYRINRSADDAAGLAISEKMRKQIRGLTQASRNAQDGISMVQIADGALAEVQDMLLRGTELSVKAANGTLSDDDRSYIQNEMTELKKEIDSVSKKTKFNEIYVLKGNGYPVTKDPDTITITGTMPGWAVMSSTTKLDGTYIKNQEFKFQENGQDKTDTITIDHASASIDFSAFTPDKLQDLIGNGFYTTCCTCTNHYSIKFTDDTASSMETSGEHYIYNIGIKGVTTAEELMERIIRGTDNGNPRNHYTMLTMDATKQKLIVYDDRSSGTEPPATSMPAGYSWVDWKHVSYGVTPSGNTGKFGPGVAYAVEGKEYGPEAPVILQIGAETDPGNKMKIELPTISCKNMNIEDVDVSTVSGAEKAIDAFDGAVQYVNRERSRMGAYQNRLEHTIKNLDNIVENTQQAESRIRDTDMAKLMVEYANAQIIAQAGQSMLTQANQSSQGVLQLLQ